MWIQSTGPQLEKIDGLPYHNESIIDADNVVELKEIFIGWKNLFQKAPLKIKVLDFYYEEDHVNHYKYLDRARIILELGEAIKLMEQAIENKNCVLYEGV